MADQTCTACGAQMPSGAAFCTQCGNRFDAPPTEVVAPDEPATEAVEPVAPDAPLTEPVAPDAPAPEATQVVTPQADPTQVWTSPPPAAPEAAPSTPSAFPPPAAPQPAPPAAPLPPVSAEAPPQGPPPAFTAPPQGPPPAYAAPSAAPPRATAAPWGPVPAASPYGQAPAPVGTAAQGAPPGPPRPSGGGKVGAVVALLGGASIIVGAFLPWLTSTPTGGVEQTITGWTLSGDAKIDVAIGAIAVVLAVVVLAGNLRAVARPLLLIGGVAAIGIAAFDTYDILKRLPDRLASTFPEGAKLKAPGLGLILVFVGGALLVIGAIAMRAKSDPGWDGATAQHVQPPAPQAPQQPFPAG